MNEQMEFDLVSPYLAEPTVCRELREQAEKHAQISTALQQRARLEARLSHEDLVYGPVTAVELGEAKTLLGADEWQRTHKLWERRAAKNPLAFRKVILAVKAKLNL